MHVIQRINLIEGLVRIDCVLGLRILSLDPARKEVLDRLFDFGLEVSILIGGSVVISTALALFRIEVVLIVGQVNLVQGNLSLLTLDLLLLLDHIYERVVLLMLPFLAIMNDLKGHVKKLSCVTFWSWSAS